MSADSAILHIPWSERCESETSPSWRADGDNDRTAPLGQQIDGRAGGRSAPRRVWHGSCISAASLIDRRAERRTYGRAADGRLPGDRPLPGDAPEGLGAA